MSADHRLCANLWLFFITMSRDCAGRLATTIGGAESTLSVGAFRDRGHVPFLSLGVLDLIPPSSFDCFPVMLPVIQHLLDPHAGSALLYLTRRDRHRYASVGMNVLFVLLRSREFRCRSVFAGVLNHCCRLGRGCPHWLYLGNHTLAAATNEMKKEPS